MRCSPSAPNVLKPRRRAAKRSSVI
ncbi:unnamed protein product [Callosobruchus maculatus]|uniref:Uncharacterized protein n=1 Tax=Callosobruchus maculatus TaxID=64391 RepID=A0A653DGS9_CALMS|nr:unnamed protein product [Callosobruchus maculatus]